MISIRRRIRDAHAHGHRKIPRILNHDQRLHCRDCDCSDDGNAHVRLPRESWSPACGS